MALHKVAVAAKDGQATPTAIPGGIQQHDTSGTGAGPNQPMIVAVDSAGNEIFGLTTDPASIATDVTAVGFIALLKQISKSIQAAAASLASLVVAIGSTAWDLGSGTGGTRTQRMILDSSQIASVLDCSTTVTRPADTNAYTAGDTFANSTSAPTAGGFTFANAAGVSGGGGIITDAVIVASGGTLYQGEVWIFDSAIATPSNDNAAFALTDADALLVLGKIPFTLALEDVNNSSAHVSGLNIGYHCIGSTNLRFEIKLLNAPTPVSAETLTVRIKGARS